jgi:hypothetical protein
MHHIPYSRASKSAQQVLEASKQFYAELKERRSVRFFSDKAVDRRVVEQLIKTAGSAPSGANKQPWHFVAISNPSPEKKNQGSCRKRRKSVLCGTCIISMAKRSGAPGYKLAKALFRSGSLVGCCF